MLRARDNVWNFFALGGVMMNSANYSEIASHLMRLQAMLEPDFSVLRDYIIRPLPVALAHRLANARSVDPYLDNFHHLYETLAASDRTRCLAEMAQLSHMVSGH